MPIYKKPNGTYQLYWRKGNQNVYKTFDKKSSANLYEKKLNEEFDKGRDLTQLKKQTLGSLLMRYRDEVSIHKEDFLAEKRQINRLLLKYDWMLSVRLDNLNQTLFNKFKNKRLEDVGHISSKHKGNYRATNKDLILFGSVLDTARNEWDIGVHNFAKDIKKFKKGKSSGRRRIIRRSEYKTLLNAKFHSQRDYKIWRALLVFLRHNPIRPVDLHKLTWNEIDIDNRKIIIRKPKNNLTRQIDILGPRMYISELRDYTKSDNKVIPKSQRAVIMDRQRLLEKYNIEDLELYDFKRHAVTKLIKKGKDISYVTKQAGWKNFNMAYTYFQEEGIYGL